MKRFDQIWWGSLFIKLIAGALLPLLSDECYYWVWSHNLQLSYYDHPPLVALLFWFGHPFENLGHASRWPAIVLIHASLLIWRNVLKPLMPTEQLNLWLILCLLNPMTGVGSIIITPDTPLLFFWPLGLWALLKLLEDPRPLRYAALGATLGLGFCSKYNFVLFVPLAIAWLTYSHQWTKIRARYVPITFISGLVFSSPVLIWNYQHHFDSFLYQLRHGLGQSHVNPSWTLEYLGGQILLLFPIVVFLALRKWNTRGESQVSAMSWLGFWAWFPLSVFLVTSFKGRVEANWPLVAYPAVFALAVLNGWNRQKKWLAGTALIWAVALALVTSEVLFEWLPVDPKKLKTYEFEPYEKLIPYAQEYHPFYANSFQMAAYLSYKLRKPIYKLNGMGRRDYYDYTPESLPREDRIYLAFNHFDAMPPELTKNYKAVKQIAQITEDLFIHQLDRKK